MELQFEPKTEKYLHQALFQTQNIEETQEIKLPPDLPDVGHVINVWGQCVLRSKQWQGDTITVSGGVMAWILYQSAEEDARKVTEAWVPFQARWTVPDSGTEGTVRACCTLSAVDARMVSARRMMLRVGVSVTGEALRRQELTTYTPCQLPPDIQILTKTYPMLLPKESSERSFTVEAEQPLPAAGDGVPSILCSSVFPVIQEQKISGSRLAFRGIAQGRVLYDLDGTVQSWDCEMPFSQVAELDGEYDADSRVSVIPAVTSVEAEYADGKLQLHCGLTGQYMVCSRTMAELTEDAYSPLREIQLEKDTLDAPAFLDGLTKELTCECSLGSDGTVMDLSFCPESVQQTWESGSAVYRISGNFRSLEKNDAGELISETGKGECPMEVAQGENTTGQLWLQCAGLPSAGLSPDGNSGRCRITAQVNVLSGQSPEMIRSISAGENKQRDKNRPSLLLCRPRREETLWQLAKRCGSTVDAISAANHLTDNPPENQLLLIPLIS